MQIAVYSKLNQGSIQPRSQGSLLPVGRVGENPGNEDGIKWAFHLCNKQCEVTEQALRLPLFIDKLSVDLYSLPILYSMSTVL